jgi:hypothetical protein
MSLIYQDFFWCCRTGLNCRPLPYQGSALPLNYGDDAGTAGWILDAIDRRALADRFHERIETAQRVDPTYGAYNDLLAADLVA